MAELQELSDLSGLNLKPEVLEIVTPPTSPVNATSEPDPSLLSRCDCGQLWEMNQLKITPTALSDMLKAPIPFSVSVLQGTLARSHAVSTPTALSHHGQFSLRPQAVKAEKIKQTLS